MTSVTRCMNRPPQIWRLSSIFGSRPRLRNMKSVPKASLHQVALRTQAARPWDERCGTWLAADAVGGAPSLLVSLLYGEIVNFTCRGDFGLLAQIFDLLVAEVFDTDKATFQT
jgi:hypothetical protein